MRAVGWLVAAVALAAPSAAWANGAQWADLCVGDSLVVAPDGVRVTYTEPDAKTGSVDLAGEFQAAYAGAFAKSASIRVLPNVEYFKSLGVEPDAWKPSAADSAEYARTVDSEPSRVVVYGVVPGEETFTLWGSRDGKVEWHKFVVSVHHCGATTAKHALTFTNVCEGAAAFIPEGTYVESHNPDVFFSGVGERTGVGFVAGLRPGFTQADVWTDGSEPVVAQAAVFPAYSPLCPEVDAGRLQPTDEPRQFLLDLCPGEFWVLPLTSSVSSVAASGTAIFSDRVAGGEGAMVLAVRPGQAELNLGFDDPDVEALNIRVSVSPCFKKK